jgi:hypothetical protein
MEAGPMSTTVAAHGLLGAVTKLDDVEARRAVFALGKTGSSLRARAPASRAPPAAPHPECSKASAIISALAETSQISEIWLDGATRPGD